MKMKRQKEIEESKFSKAHSICDQYCKVESNGTEHGEEKEIGCPVVAIMKSIPEDMPPMEDFQMEKMKFLVGTLVEQSKSNKMQVDLYTTFYEESLKLFCHMGSATKLAFSDIRIKANQIRDCQKTLTKVYHLDEAPPGSLPHNASLYIEQMILFEIEKD